MNKVLQVWANSVHLTLMTSIPLLLKNHPFLQLFHFLDHRKYLHNRICRTSTSSVPQAFDQNKKNSFSSLPSALFLFFLLSGISLGIVHFSNLWLWTGTHFFLLRLSALPESSPGSDCFSSSEFPFVLDVEHFFFSLRFLCKFQHYQKPYKTYTRRQTHHAYELWESKLPACFWFSGKPHMVY